jgi:outer membrane protein assembly factor BamB
MTNCSGTPKTCAPLWTAPTGLNNGSSPTVANGVVYRGSGDGTLRAFDAAGTTNCSGTPRTCAPLWTAPTGGAGLASPAVANGVVYVQSGNYGFTSGSLFAFSAAGTTNCSGAPKTCTPLWTALTGGTTESLAVANGNVYVSSRGTLLAFDAAGMTNCSGAPKNCAPLWTWTVSGTFLTAPAVANGVIYVGSAGDAKLYAFRAAGGAPLWTASTLTSPRSSPAVANGVVYVGSGSYLEGKLRAFDAAGTRNCSGTPKTCAPLWTTSFGDDVNSSPAVANGVVYVGSLDNKLYAFGL